MKKRLSLFVLAVAALFECADYDLLESVEPDPVELEIIGVTDTTVTLRWTRSTAEDFSSYAVYYSSGKNDVPDSADKLADTLFFAQDTQKTVWDLDPGTDYFFRVIVNTTGGKIAPSNIVDTTTLPDSRTRKIVLEIDSLALTDVSLTVRWSDTWGEGPYRVYVDTAQTVDSTDTALVETRRVNDDTSQTIIGLEPSTGYRLRVYGLDASGSPQVGSNTIMVTTLRSEPDSVTLTVVDSTVTDVAAALWWTTNHNRDFYRYILRIDTNHIGDTLTEVTGSDTTFGDPTDTTVGLTGLIDSSTYYVRLFVQDTADYLTASNLDSFTTLAGVPEPVALRIDRQALTDTSVPLTWTRTTAADFAAYDLYWDSTGTVDTAAAGSASVSDPGDTTFTVVLPDLARYRFVVYVRDNDGNAARSGEVVNFPIVLHAPSRTDSTVDLVWTEYTGEGFQAYKIYRGDTPGVTNTIMSLETYLGEIEREHTDSPPDTGKAYFYRVFVEVEGSEAVGSNEVEVEF